jgi:hypothetical protein
VGMRARRRVPDAQAGSRPWQECWWCTAPASHPPGRASRPA